DSRVIVLDLASGRPRAGPVKLGFEPVRHVQYADLDGDGEPEIIAVGPGSPSGRQSLCAFSIVTGKGLWTTPINVNYAMQNQSGRLPDWPWLVDLDGDGRCEVIVPAAGPMHPKGGFRGVEVLDGASGRSRWVHPAQPETKAEDGLDRIVEAPDLDG